MPNDPEIHRRLGELQGSLAAIQRQLVDNEAKASESRDKVYEALGRIRADAANTRHMAETSEKILEHEVRPVVRSVVDWRSRTLGGLFVLGAIGTAVLFILGLAKELLVDLWHALMRH